MSRIAIIGSGISGLGAAYLLNPQHDITVYEAAATIGGHTRTKVIHYDGLDMSVDTGFIVFNHRNYPHLTALFKHLDVATQKSNMTFGISVEDGKIEWGAQSPNALFGQRRNLFNPKFYRFLFDILRFNARASALAEKNPELTLGQLITKMRMGDWFAKYYILPMGGAIWSCPLPVMLGFPALNFVRFFKAHGLLTVTQQPQWYTVTGGTHEYLKKLTAGFKDKIRVSTGVVSVTRMGGRVQVVDVNGNLEEYDDVVLACHANQALAILKDADMTEQVILSGFGYQPNVAVLHKDMKQMPKQRRCWSSWVYLSDGNDNREHLTVTYWMNQLQSLDNNRPVFVTLNPLTPIADADVFDRHVFDHPVYSLASDIAQKRMGEIQGKNHTWFCGAHLSNGFHEDGLASGVAVAKALGATLPWA